MPPLIATPTREANTNCTTCGSTLLRTGNPVSFGDSKGTMPSMVNGRATRGHQPYRGWIPSLLVAVCPTCDVWTPEPEPTATTSTASRLRDAFGRFTKPKSIENLTHDEADQLRINAIREAYHARLDGEQT